MGDEEYKRGKKTRQSDMEITDDPLDNHPFRKKMQHAAAAFDDDRLRDLIESLKRQENRMDIIGAKLSQLEEADMLLANEDALRIFLAAKDGIEKSTKTIKELKLTQKRYYLRIRELLKAGLIENRDNVYQLTTLGNICWLRNRNN